MKDRKRLIKWIVLLAGLAVLILLLTMCTRGCSGEPEETLPALAAETAPPAAVTEQTEETTLPTQETTAPTEETTEPTEESTEATTAPTTDSEDSDEEDEDFGEEEEYWEGPDPGTPENPYVEVREGYPAEVESVNIPRGTEVSYVITGSAGSVITIKDPGVTLTVDGKTYTADETTGELTVDLSKLAADPVIQLSHSGKTAASCVLNLSEGLGGAGNPEPLTDPTELEVRLPAGDSNGYHYMWTSSIIGQVELTLKETEEEAPEENPEAPAEGTEGESGTEEIQPPEEPVLEIIVTIGEQVIKLSECEDGKLTFDTTKEQEVLIQVIAQPFADGTYPEIEETILWTLYPDLGTAENPEPIESIDSISVALEKDDAYGHHYLWTATTYGDVTLTADKEALDVVATVGETVCKLSDTADEAVIFHVDKGQTVLIQAVAIPTPGEEETEEPVYPAVSGTITGTIQPDPGTPENPVVLEAIDTVTVTLAEGDCDGYTCQWTALYGGTLELTAQDAETKLEVILTNTASGATQRLTESETGILTADAEAGDVLTIQTMAVPDENGGFASGKVLLKGTFTAEPGSSAENPILISDPAAGATFAMEARQTLYFSGMVHEMIAKVNNASGVTIHCGEETVWGSLNGVAEMEFPAADAEEPVVFSVTSKNEKELTLTFAYPAGHEKNPAQLALGETRVTLEENDTDGYLLNWTAECDGLLTIAVSGKSGWQYQLDNLTTDSYGQRYTSSQEPQTASLTLEVKAGEQLRLTLWTLTAAEEAPLPSGTLTVTASFYDPLLGTEAKPIRLETGELDINTVTVPAGQTLYYAAEAEGLILTLTGRDVTLIHSGAEHLPESGKLELLCHGAESVFQIRNESEKDQLCKLSFAYPEGHRKNPAALVMGENTAVMEDGSLSGYAFAWTAEGSGQLTITMAENVGWQYILSNETAGAAGVVHTCEDKPSAASETLEVTKGDRILVIVNTFDMEHPLNTPAGEVVFTAEFVDPTLGMEENPIWLDLEDEITIPAGKTMYCTAKADGMILTLKGSRAAVSHNGVDYSAVQNTVTLLCTGTGTFGHPVLAITNTGPEDEVYTVSFAYPEGHFLNPAELELKETTVSLENFGTYGYYFLWTAKENGTFTFTMNNESGWEYLLTNLTTGEAGGVYSSEDEEPVLAESIQVSAGDQLRIMVDLLEPVPEGEAPELTYTAAFAPEESEKE